jgi:hypothetical protein
MLVVPPIPGGVPGSQIVIFTPSLVQPSGTGARLTKYLGVPVPRTRPINPSSTSSFKTAAAVEPVQVTGQRRFTVPYVSTAPHADFVNSSPCRDTAGHIPLGRLASEKYWTPVSLLLNREDPFPRKLKSGDQRAGD